MSGKGKSRITRVKLYDHLYKEMGYIGIDPCIYCGIISSSYDHVPPLFEIEAIKSVGLSENILRKYPACQECNSILGTSRLHFLRERRLYLLKYYKRKFRNLLNMPTWDEEEFNDLGPTLANDVRSHKKFSEFMKRRIKILQYG